MQSQAIQMGGSSTVAPPSRKLAPPPRSLSSGNINNKKIYSSSIHAARARYIPVFTFGCLYSCLAVRQLLQQISTPEVNFGYSGTNMTSRAT